MTKRKERKPRENATRSSTGSGAGRAAAAVSSSDLRQKRQQERRRRQFTIVGGIIAVIAVLAAIAIVVNTLPADAPIPAGVVERYTDIPTDFTDQGYPRLGDVQNTRIRVTEYSSFSCPSCLVMHETLGETILKRVNAGDITFTYVPLGQYGGAGGEDAAIASLCVAEQDAFWSYHDVLFNWQSTFGRQAFTLNRLRAGVSALGLDVDAYNTCMSSGRANDVVRVAEAEAQALEGFIGTPHLMVNGVPVPLGVTPSEFDAIIDNILALGGATNQPTTPTEEPAATEEAVATEEISATEEVVVTEEAVATEEISATEEAIATEEATATEESAG